MSDEEDEDYDDDDEEEEDEDEDEEEGEDAGEEGRRLHLNLLLITSNHLHHITSHYITLHHITSHHITLHHVTSRYITLHQITLQTHFNTTSYQHIRIISYEIRKTSND